MSKKGLAARAKKAGLFVDTCTPEDGVTRYRFFASEMNYFAELYTARGFSEAEVFLEGFLEGRQFEMSPRIQTRERGKATGSKRFNQHSKKLF